MAWTTAERDALQSAIAKGLKSVDYGDRSVTYQDLDQMRDLLDEMNRDLAGSTGTAYTYRLAATSKGLT